LLESEVSQLVTQVLCLRNCGSLDMYSEPIFVF